MRRRPAKSVVQLARRVQHVVKRIFGLHLPLRPHIRPHLPTASCSPWIFLILHSGHLPTAVLSVRLLVLPLASALLVVVVAVVLSYLLSTETLVTCLRLRSPWCLDDTSNSELDGTHRRIGDGELIGHLHELNK